MKLIDINPLTRLTRTFAVLFLAAFLFAGLFSCKKDKKTKSDQLKQKWDLVIRYDTVYLSAFGPSDTTEYAGKAGDYYTFGNDDTVIISEKGTITKFHYTFDESAMILRNDFSQIYEIRTLTDDQLELFTQHFFNARRDQWQKTHIYLKR
jgi:hypothetical protein